MKMQAHFLPAFLLPLLALTLACERDDTQMTEPVLRGQAFLTARGKPDLVERVLLEHKGQNPFICNGDPVLDGEVNGQFVDQIWATGEPFIDETLAKTHYNLYVTFTNPETGASITSHQVLQDELLIIDWQFVNIRTSGGYTATSPGDGIVIQRTGVLKVTTDFSVSPPERTIEFHGKGNDDIAAIVC